VIINSYGRDKRRNGVLNPCPERGTWENNGFRQSERGGILPKRKERVVRKGNNPTGPKPKRRERENG